MKDHHCLRALGPVVASRGADPLGAARRGAKDEALRAAMEGEIPGPRLYLHDAKRNIVIAQMTERDAVHDEPGDAGHRTGRGASHEFVER